MDHTMTVKFNRPNGETATYLWPSPSFGRGWLEVTVHAADGRQRMAKNLTCLPSAHGALEAMYDYENVPT